MIVPTSSNTGVRFDDVKGLIDAETESGKPANCSHVSLPWQNSQAVTVPVVSMNANANTICFRALLHRTFLLATELPMVVESVEVLKIACILVMWQVSPI